MISTIGGRSNVSEADVAGDSEAIPDGVGVPEVSGEAAMARGVPVFSVPLSAGGFSPPAEALPVQRVPVSGLFDGGNDLPQDADAAAEVVLAGTADEPEQARSVHAGGATNVGNPLLQGDLDDVP